MTISITRVAPVPAPAAPEPASASAEPERELPGRTTVSERAVERIAARVLAEVDDVGGTARKLLGVAVGDADPDGDAAVRARVDGETVTLQAKLSVVYPASVRRTTAGARERLRARVGALTGLAVRQVDIVVTALPGTAPARRVE